MRKRLITGLGGLAMLLALCVPVEAQTTTGRIRGEVRDSEGAPMPGVTITIESDALMGTQSAVTGNTGAYRFTGLPIGTYTVQAVLEGFGTREQDTVQVSLGGTASVDFTMTPAFEEAVTVTSEAPVMDTTSSKKATVYDKELLENVPTNRNYYDLMTVSPGVSLAAEDSDRVVALGSNVQSNAWYIDGIETTAPETGTAWVSPNPDTIEAIEVVGIGAPAEFGGMMGAALNVVTKSGGNAVEGGVNAYWFDDSLVDSDLNFEDSEFQEYNQDEFVNLTATLGGPIVKDRLWYFAGYEYWRDGHTYPGSDPDQTSTWYSDKYDLKLSSAINPKNSLEVKAYYNEWGFPAAPSPYVTQSASAGEVGDTTAWGLSYQSIFSDRMLFEARYSGWQSNDDNLSQTGSQDPAFIDYNPPGGGPTTISGGVWYPWTYDTSTDQVSASLSYFADEFIQGEHDFKFGVQLSQGTAETLVAPSATGTYYYQFEYYGYEYYYKAEGRPYIYGNEQESIGVFVDDSWTVTDRLTLNVGLRFDRVEGSIPNFPVFTLDGEPTNETVPGVDPAFTWNNLSPRLGFAYNAGEQRNYVFTGSFGVYYDGNVGGNWNYPPPNHPGVDYFYSVGNGFEGPYEYSYTWSPGESTIDPDLEAPRTLQYALGAERQIGSNWAIGLQGVYKDTTDLIGWEILDDGVYEEISYTDPFTGRTYTLLDPIEFPTVRKGNSPGFTVDPSVDEYWQEYYAGILTVNRRFTDRWSMKASYTYSESTGLIPRFLSQWQFNPFYSSREGDDPNSYLNVGDGILLQGDRPHMFRLQATVELPWQLNASTNINIQSGRPFYREARLPTGGTPVAIMDADGRHPTQELVDLALGREFNLGGDVVMRTEIQVLNLLNDDATDWFETVILSEGDDFIPTYWVKPRRLQLRLGFSF